MDALNLKTEGGLTEVLNAIRALAPPGGGTPAGS